MSNFKPWAKRPDAPARMSGRKAVERRARWLRSSPLCVECEAQGRVAAGTDVDHITPLAKGGADDESNLQTLCRSCHDAKSLKDKGYKPRIQFDTQGRVIW